MSCRPGELRAHHMLGTSAFYRVRLVEGDMVHVEVVRAPGLRPGARIRLLASAVMAMERVDETPTEADDVSSRPEDWLLSA